MDAGTTTMSEPHSRLWLKPEDRGGMAITVEIALVPVQESRQRDGAKKAAAVIAFDRATKRLIANKTQVQALATILGSERFDDWPGKTVALAPATAPNASPLSRSRGYRQVDDKGPQQSCAATHEAGHAVVAVVLGLPLSEVSIIPEGKSGGRIKYKDNAEMAPCALPTRRAVPIRYEIDRNSAHGEETLNRNLVRVAGVVAVLMDVSPDVDWACCDYTTFFETADFGGLLGSIEHLCPTDEKVAEYIASCIARTQALLRENWEAVRAVSGALRKSRSLTADEVCHIMQEAHNAG